MRRCPSCGREVAQNKKFCGACGASMAVQPQAAQAAPPPVVPPPVRAKPPVAPPPLVDYPPPPPIDQPLPEIPKGQLEQNPWIGLGVVFGAGVVLSYVGWMPLSIPAQLIGSVVPVGRCTQYEVNSTPMFWCSAGVALQYLAGPLLLMVLMFVMRRQIANLVKQLIPRVPADYLFLVAPLAATLVFTMTWAPAHSGLENAMGLVPQMMFPALVGVYTYGISRFGPHIQRNFRGMFEFRESIPKIGRIAALIAIPFLIGKVTMMNQVYVGQPALKEQFIVLLCMCLGYLALAPLERKA